MLPKVNRITDPKDFKLTMRKGKRIATPTVTLFVRTRTDELKRYGFVVTKKTGNAVARNKLKRQMREIAFAHMKAAGKGVDIIMMATPKADTVSWDELNKAILTRI
jgi:ribonuclease P protein component